VARTSPGRPVLVSLGSAAVIAAVALIVPLALRLTGLSVPDAVAEIVAGIVIGPELLGWAHLDDAVRVLSVLGLAFLLFLAGLEIDFTQFRGRVLLLTTTGFVISFALALAVGAAFGRAGLVRSPVLIAVILSATSLGIVLPVLKDSGQLHAAFGRVVVAGASIAEVVPILLLSLLFSADAGSVGSRAALLTVFLVFSVALAVSVVGAEHSRRLSRALLALQETTAEIRVRAAFALLLLLAALATRFGVEAILGAFLAGATVRLVERDEQMTHSLLRNKLQAVGFGVFIPFFFVSTGMSLDVHGLFGDAGALARAPLFQSRSWPARSGGAAGPDPAVQLRGAGGGGPAVGGAVPAGGGAVAPRRPRRRPAAHARTRSASCRALICA
jgi:Kef-type K+ transport system membrane component KefB